MYFTRTVGILTYFEKIRNFIAFLINFIDLYNNHISQNVYVVYTC